ASSPSAQAADGGSSGCARPVRTTCARASPLPPASTTRPSTCSAVGAVRAASCAASAAANHDATTPLQHARSDAMLAILARARSVSTGVTDARSLRRQHDAVEAAVAVWRGVRGRMPGDREPELARLREVALAEVELLHREPPLGAAPEVD